MAKECGQSESFKSFDEQIGSVMDSIGVNKIAGDGGVADNISGLKDFIKSQTDAINEKLELAVPEIPEPELNLQDEMKGMMEGIASGDPGTAMDKLNSMKEKFPGVDMDQMLEENGLDSKELETQRKKFNKQKADASVLAQFSAQKNKLGEKFNLTEGQQALLDLGQGKLSGAKALLGGLSQDKLIKDGTSLDGILDGICTKVKNVDLDANGKEILKGVETKVPEIDAEALEDKLVEVLADVATASTNNDSLKQSENITISEFDEDTITILEEKRENIKNTVEPLTIENRNLIQKFVTVRKKSQKDLNRHEAINFIIGKVEVEETLVANKKLKELGKKVKPFAGDKTISSDDLKRFVEPHSDLKQIQSKFTEVKTSEDK